MEEKKEEKVQYYFNFISKEEFPKFIERFKEALEKTDNKKGEKNNFEIEIRGTRELLDGIQIEFFNFDLLSAISLTSSNILSRAIV